MKIKSFILIALIHFSLFSQREADHWYFGKKAGFHFNTGKLDVLNDSKMNTPAGCSSISDIYGRLLFYTDGNTVWNKNHQKLENGEGLAGEITNSQTSIIIPKPNSTTNFYIFTTRQSKQTSPLLFPGIYLSEVEISTKYPLGKLILKNKRLENSTSQKITAVHHKNGKDVWVITHGSRSFQGTDNVFFSFKVTEFGVDIAIKTTLDTIEKTFLGEMKASPDGSKVAVTAGENIIIYNFDNESGKLSKFRSFFLLTSFTEGYSSYGLTFSPNSKYIYYPSYRYSKRNTYKIMQVEIDKLNHEGEYLGEAVFTEPPLRSEAAIQLASDGKIYVAQIEKKRLFDKDGKYIGNEIIPVKNIGVINEPDKFGAEADFQQDILDLEKGASLRGLPNFIQSYFRNRIITENKCVSEAFQFNLDAYQTITSANWDFGDGNSQTGLETSHKYAIPGNYIVTCNVQINGNTIPFYKEVKVFPLPDVIPNQELIQCDVNNDGIDFFDLNDITDKITTNASDKSFIFFRNIIDAQNNLKKIGNPEAFKNESVRQEIFVRIVSDKGCTNITSFFIESKFVSLGNILPIYACDNSDISMPSLKGNFNLNFKKEAIRTKFNLSISDSIRFYPSLKEAQTTSSLINNNFTSPSTTIFVRVDTPLGCGGIEPLELIVNNKPKINIQDSYTICITPSLHNAIILDGNASNDKYEWRNSLGKIISTNQNFTLNTIGKYSLTVYKTENNLECSNYKEFTVNNPNPADFSEITVDTETENNTIYVRLNGNSNYEFSLDNKTFFGDGTEHKFNNVVAGLRTIYVRDKNNCEQSISSKASVIGFKKYFTPNGDGEHDFWIPKNIENFPNILIDIFDRYGRKVYKLKDDARGWSGFYEKNELPTGDYWYVIKLNGEADKREFIGHFTLYR